MFRCDFRHVLTHPLWQRRGRSPPLSRLPPRSKRQNSLFAGNWFARPGRATDVLSFFSFRPHLLPNWQTKKENKHKIRVTFCSQNRAISSSWLAGMHGQSVFFFFSLTCRFRLIKIHEVIAAPEARAHVAQAIFLYRMDIIRQISERISSNINLSLERIPSLGVVSERMVMVMVNGTCSPTRALIINALEQEQASLGLVAIN